MVFQATFRRLAQEFFRELATPRFLMEIAGRGEAAPRPYKASRKTMVFFQCRASLKVSAGTPIVGVDLCVRPKGLSCLNGLGADTWVRLWEGDRKFILGAGHVPHTEMAGRRLELPGKQGSCGVGARRRLAATSQLGMAHSRFSGKLQVRSEDHSFPEGKRLLGEKKAFSA